MPTTTAPEVSPADALRRYPSETLWDAAMAYVKSLDEMPPDERAGEVARLEKGWPASVREEVLALVERRTQEPSR